MKIGKFCMYFCAGLGLCVILCCFGLIRFGGVLDGLNSVSYEIRESVINGAESSWEWITGLLD